MAQYKKKIVTFLAVVALGGGALAVWPAQSTEPEPVTENSKFKADSLFANDLNLLTKRADNPGSREMFLKMILAVLLVIVLGAAAIYISKKLLPKLANLPGKEIRIIETVYLGPRKAVHLLKIGNQWLLIGSTNENITQLADVTDALADLSTQETEA